MATGAALATGEPQAVLRCPRPRLSQYNGSLVGILWYERAGPCACRADSTGPQGKDTAFHEIPDQFGILERLTKSSHRVTGGGDAVGHVVDAFTSLVSGRPQPVELEIAVNLWTQDVTGTLPVWRRPGCPRRPLTLMRSTGRRN